MAAPAGVTGIYIKRIIINHSHSIRVGIRCPGWSGCLKPLVRVRKLLAKGVAHQLRTVSLYPFDDLRFETQRCKKRTTVWHRILQDMGSLSRNPLVGRSRKSTNLRRVFLFLHALRRTFLRITYSACIQRSRCFPPRQRKFPFLIQKSLHHRKSALLLLLLVLCTLGARTAPTVHKSRMHCTVDVACRS